MTHYFIPLVYVSYHTKLQLCHLLIIYLFIYLLFFYPHPRMCLFFLETVEGRERKRDIDVWRKHQSLASHMFPNGGLNLQSRYVPWPVIESAIFFYFLLYGMMFQPTGSPSQDWILTFNLLINQATSWNQKCYILIIITNY